MATGSINISGGSGASSDDITRIKYDLWISDIQKYGNQSRIYNDPEKLALLLEDGEIYNDPECKSILPIDVNRLSVGDEIVVPHTSYGNIPFIVIGKDHDGEGTATLLTKYVVEKLAFDAKESSNSDSNRQSNGNNRYLYSNLLQWMNSEVSGNWYTAQHSADQAPNSTSVVSENPYTSRPGLLYGFSDDFKSKLVTVNKTTAKNTVTDGGGSEIVSSKAFLLSTTEVGLANENNIAEGTIYEYFSRNNQNNQRIAYLASDTSTAAWYWLRTPHSGNSCSERYVYTSGALAGNYYACNGYGGLRFGLVIANQ